MPKKRDGQTQKSIQIPDPLLAAADARRGETSLNAYICELIARDTKTPYTPVAPGRPRANPEPPEPPKPRRAPAKPRGRKSK